MSTDLTESHSDLSKILILLLRSVVYAELQPKDWQTILNQRAAIQQYVNMLNLQLLIDESEGYAFLRPLTVNDDDKANSPLPSLQPKRPLGFMVSLLCIILRKKLIEQDSESGNIRVILTREQLSHELQTLLPEETNQVKQLTKIDQAINKAIDIGFLRQLKTEDKRYEICRILKAFINADWLNSTAKLLEDYHEHAKKHL